MNDLNATREAYDEVYVYAMSRPGFILQHVVDAFAVQNATEELPAIGVIFGLVGLYLHTEKQFLGLQVQEVHKKMARSKRHWPKLNLPKDRGHMTALDVLSAPAGIDRGQGN